MLAGRTAKLLAALAFIGASWGSAQPTTPAGASALAEFNKELAARRPVLLEGLTSGEETRVSAALQEIDDWLDQAIPSTRSKLIELLVECGRFDDAEKRAVDFILRTPGNNWAISNLQRLRVTILLQQGKKDQALAAAGVYYNVCRYSETRGAIELVSRCLAAVHPEDESLVQRFRAQQVAWAVRERGERPDEDEELGDPILLASKQDESSPFVKALSSDRAPNGYLRWTSRGNLLLLSGEPTAAKEAFERAYAAATEKQRPTAIENVARAIRASDGYVCRANAYLASVQSSEKP